MYVLVINLQKENLGRNEGLSSGIVLARTDKRYERWQNQKLGLYRLIFLIRIGSFRQFTTFRLPFIFKKLNIKLKNKKEVKKWKKKK